MRIRKLKNQALEILKGNWINVIGASLVFAVIPFLILQGLDIKAIGIFDNCNFYKPFSSNILRWLIVIIVFIIQPYFVLCFIKYCSNLMTSKRRIAYIECIVHWRQYLRFLGIVVVDFMMMSVIGFIILQIAEATSSNIAVSALFVILFFIEVFVVFIFAFPAGFLIAQNHGISFEDALKTSLLIVRRNFWSAAYLWLSFIGWAIVGIVTLGIGFIWVAPYATSTMALYVNSKNRGFTGGITYSPW